MMVEVDVKSDLECPILREALVKVKEAIDSKLNSKRKGKIYSRKTIGVLRVHFSDGEVTTIAALSGIGVNQWTFEDLKDFNNDAFQDVKAALNEKNILWADMSGDARRATYQHMQEQQPIEDEVALKENFKEEYKKRFRNKIKSLREVKGLSDRDIADALKRSAEYRPELERDYKENVIPAYVDLYNNENSPILQAVEKVIDWYFQGGKEPYIALLLRDPLHWIFFLLIRNDIVRAEDAPTTAQEVVDRFIAPYRGAIPEVLLGVYCFALGFPPAKPSNRLADMTVQCAEDNALICLIEKSKEERKVVRRIEWVAAQLSKDKGLVYKALCPFCAVAFVPRAKQINNVIQAQLRV